MKRRSTVLAAAAAVCALTLSGQTNRPEFKPAPEVPAMPKALMKFPRTQITREVSGDRFPSPWRRSQDRHGLQDDRPDGPGPYRDDLQHGRRIRECIRRNIEVG